MTYTFQQAIAGWHGTTSYGYHQVVVQAASRADAWTTVRKLPEWANEPLVIISEVNEYPEGHHD